MEYIGYIRALRAHGKLKSEWTIVNAILTRLGLGFSQEWVDELNSRRYNVVTDTQENYQASLERVENICKSLVTRIALLKKEVDDYQPKNSQEKKEKELGFEMLMASLCDGLGREVPDTITLARYDEYCLIIKRKRRAKKEEHGRV